MLEWFDQPIQANVPTEISLAVKVQKFALQNQHNDLIERILPMDVVDLEWWWGGAIPKLEDLVHPEEGMTLSAGTTRELSMYMLMIADNGLPMWWKQSRAAFLTEFNLIMQEDQALSPKLFQLTQEQNPSEALSLTYRVLWSMYQGRLTTEPSNEEK